MDPLTHALASYTLKRAAFPRATRSATIAILAAGTFADLDNLSAYFGPSAFLVMYRTYFHSIAAAVLFSILPSLLISLWVLFRRRNTDGFGVVIPLKLPAYCFAAALLHLLMDLCQSDA